MGKKSKIPPLTFVSELVEISDLKEHPRNYRRHGEGQVAHIAANISENGFYKNVVVAEDRTILAGHGAVAAARSLGIEKIPVVKLSVSPNDSRALKILTGDNEVSKLAEVDDRLLSELLKEVAAINFDELIGTGFDSKQLANLVYVTRDSNEIKDFNAAAEWVGLPAYDIDDPTKKSELVIEITFKNDIERERYVKENGLKIRDKRGGRKWSTVWPYEERNDLKSVKFEGDKK